MAPGRAADDLQRRALYAAALEQFEQLLHAARGVGPAARPLPLFYALSQAGRAIVAAHGDDPQVEGHGLAEDRRSPQPNDPLHRCVKASPTKHGREAFRAVSRATGSPALTAPVELGALWAALPGTYRLPSDSWRPKWRASLGVLDESYRGEPGQTRVQVASLGGNPHVEPAATLVQRYPTVPADAQFGVKPGSEALGPGNWIAVMTWSSEHNLDAITPAPEGSTDSKRHLPPTLPDYEELLTPLMMWWVLLFGLSIFARYHPALWVQALDVDRSEHAVPLEGLLDRALDVVPTLVHEALLG